MNRSGEAFGVGFLWWLGVCVVVMIVAAAIDSREVGIGAVVMVVAGFAFNLGRDGDL